MTEIQAEEQPIGAVVQSGSGAVAKTDQVRAIAEVQAALVIARQNPRDPIEAMDRLVNACCRPGLAMSALYTYARGGSDISGPSIRLAEAEAQAWGNIQFGIRELEQRDGESTVQAFAWDVETNTRREVTFQVPHVRYTKTKGNVKLYDPRDIYEMVANQGARRLRACILGIIPGDVTEAAVLQCEKTMKEKADTSPEAMMKMVESFAEFGVLREQIEKRIQRRIEAIQPAQVVALRKIYTSLRDNMSSPADWFEVPQVNGEGTATRTDQLASTLDAKTLKPSAVAEGPIDTTKAVQEILEFLKDNFADDADRQSWLREASNQAYSSVTAMQKGGDSEVIILVLKKAREFSKKQ